MRLLREVVMKCSTAAELLGPLNPVEARHAPKNLFVEGDEGLLRSGPRVAIVGSRKTSPEGLELARSYATEFVRAGVVVISGLAAGVDTAAHWGAIEAGGRTVGVIGSGLDVFYPASNRKLQELIAKDHLLVSQFPPGTPPIGRNFPIRNRTMALLTEATLIVEASEQSGTRHQGWEALRLGRMVFLDERVAEDSSLSWPLELISYGAQVVSFKEIDAIAGVLPTVTDVDKLVLA